MIPFPPNNLVAPQQCCKLSEGNQDQHVFQPKLRSSDHSGKFWWELFGAHVDPWWQTICFSFENKKWTKLTTFQKKSRHCYQQWIFFHLFPNKDLSEQTKLPTIISTCSNLTTTRHRFLTFKLPMLYGTSQLLYQDLPKKAVENEAWSRDPLVKMGWGSTTNMRVQEKKRWVMEANRFFTVQQKVEKHHLINHFGGEREGWDIDSCKKNTLAKRFPVAA